MSKKEEVDFVADQKVALRLNPGLSVVTDIHKTEHAAKRDAEEINDGRRLGWDPQLYVASWGVTPDMEWGVFVSERPKDPVSERAIADMRAAGLEPRGPYPGYEVPWPFRCTTCGHVGTILLNNVRKGRSCQRCHGDSKVLDRLRAIAAAGVADMRAAGLEPKVPYPGRNVPWFSRCTFCDQNVSPALSSVRRGTKCRFCWGGKRKHRVPPTNFEKYLKSSADQAIRQRQQAEDSIVAADMLLDAGFDPLEDYPGRTEKAWACKCRKCDLRQAVKLEQILDRDGNLCTGCAAVAVMRAAGFYPMEVYSGSSGSPWSCRCAFCGKISTPSLKNVKYGRSRCRHCRGGRRGPVVQQP